MTFRADLTAAPSLDRPAVWRRAPVGYRLAWGERGQAVALILPATPSRSDPARWVADRIDRFSGGDLPRFGDLAAAVAWAESADWYGPVAPYIARGHA